MAFDLKTGVALATGVAGLAASALATLRYFIKKEQIEGDLQRLQERYNELNNRYNEVVEVIGSIKVSGTAALLLKSEIDTQLDLATKALLAKASSILVPLPGNEPTDLVFLAVLGPAAASIRRTTVPIHKGIAGYVFSQCKPYLALDARNDKKFFQGVDMLSSYTTEDILCVPVISNGATLGVLQLLNKESGAFTQQDLQIAQRFADSISVKVAQFVAEPNNFELLGFAPAARKDEGTIIFCDLTASSLLMDSLNFASAISLINAYLERSSDIVMHAGGTVDKFLGDGAMFRFNVPHEIREPRLQALRAALRMRAAFQKQKEAWLQAGMPVSALFTRIGIASGLVREAIMGHPQFQSLTVVGEPVVLASNLCMGAPRDRSAILVTPETIRGLENDFQIKAVPQSLIKKIKGQQISAYEVISGNSGDAGA